MATPPYNLDISDPTDGSLGSAFPANERTFRDNINSYINTEHDINTGYHQFQELTTAARGALGSPPKGMIVYTTDATPVGAYINTGSAGAPVWSPIMVFAVPSSYGMKSSGPLTGSGSYTLLASSVKVTMIAGGGGGGGGSNAGAAGGGGGSGSWLICWLTGLTIGQTLTYAVGTGGGGGTGGASPTGGSNGNNTSISNGTATITTRTANGGTGGGGAGANNGAGGAGGVVSTGAAGDLLGIGFNGFSWGTTAPNLAAYSASPSILHPYGSGSVGGSSSGGVGAAGTAGHDGTLFFEYTI